MYNIKMGW